MGFTYLPVARGVANLPAAVVAGAGVGGGRALLSRGRGRGGGGEGSEAGSDNGEDLHVESVLLKESKEERKMSWLQMDVLVKLLGNA